MKKLRSIVCALLLAGLTGCGTMAGIGRDLQLLGEAMEGADPTP